MTCELCTAKTERDNECFKNLFKYKWCIKIINAIIGAIIRMLKIKFSCVWLQLEWRSN